MSLRSFKAFVSHKTVANTSKQKTFLSKYIISGYATPMATSRFRLVNLQVRQEARFVGRLGYLDELTMVEIEAGASGVKRSKDLGTFQLGRGYDE